MKIKGKLTLKCENTEQMIDIISRSLAPDNVSGIRTEIDRDSVKVEFCANKIGTMLSSVDDYLMNAKIAFDMIAKVKK